MNLHFACGFGKNRKRVRGGRLPLVATDTFEKPTAKATV